MQAEVGFTKQIQFIGVPSGCGAKDNRCALGPEAVYSSNIHQELTTMGYDSHWHMLEQESVSEDVSETISNLCLDLSQQTLRAVSEKEQFVVVGGDHSCAIGSWSGVAAAKASFGLVWIDAHLDSHTPETSPSHAIHGMPLASLLGHGQKSLTHLPGPFPKIKPENVVLEGIRSFEKEEFELLKRLGVRIYFMDEVEKRGLNHVMDEAINTVTKHTEGFGISVDLDAIDPEDAPGVGSPEAGGIHGDELILALTGVAQQSGFLGLEIAELNPLVDKNNKTVQLTCQLIEAIFKGASA